MMKYILLNKYSNKLIYDGLNNGYYNHIIKCDDIDKNISLKVTDFKEIYDLKKSVSEFFFNNFINELSHEKGALYFSYKGTDGLTLEYNIYKNNNSKYLIVISSGEFQSGRYKIYLEGVWELLE